MPTHAPDITVLYDGACPICSREVAFLKRRDRDGRVGAEDIAAPGFDPARYGKTHDEVMARIHGVLPDGRVIEGLEVFRRLYAAVGLGWVAAWTGWPVLRPAADLGYRIFAKLRPRLPFRRDCSSACAPRSSGANAPA